MNIVGTLAKVAMGVMVSRGVGKLMGRKGGSGGGLLGGIASSVLGGRGGGLGGLLGSALSGGAAGGGLGGLLSSLTGGGKEDENAQAPGGLGGMLNQALGGQAAPNASSAENAQAELLLRAMINGAKADGTVDEAEQRKIVEHLEDVTEEEANFVRNEMAQPLDVDAFIRSVPKGMEQQVYLMSLLGIDLDSKAEAQYLDQLAKGMGIAPELANQIHEKLGVPQLYG